MAKQNKPAIRFKGFTDAWEQRKLGDNIVEYTEVTTENNQYPPLTSSRKGIFLQTEYFAGNQIASDDNTGYNIVPYGYFTYRHMSDDEVFHFNINDIVEKGIVSTLYPVFTTDENLDSRYLQYQLNYGHEFAKFAILQKQGGSRTYMYLNKLRQLHLTMPNHVEEQKAISSFFMNLDHLITLHQRKYDKLQVLKKAMLEKMFPKNGSSVPEIRFKGFTDAWEQRKLGEIAVFSKGVGYSKNDLCEEGTPIILYGRLYTKYETCIFDVDTFVKEKAGSVYSKGGEVIVPASGETAEDISIASVVVKPGILLGGDLNIVSPTAEYDSAFLALTISSGATHKHLSSLAQGKSVVHLHNSDIQSVSAKFPTKREQEKIHLIFGKIDTLITLHQRELEKLQNIKKSMLEKMFV